MMKRRDIIEKIARSGCKNVSRERIRKMKNSFLRSSKNRSIKIRAATPINTYGPKNMEIKRITRRGKTFLKA